MLGDLAIERRGHSKWRACDTAGTHFSEPNSLLQSIQRPARRPQARPPNGCGSRAAAAHDSSTAVHRCVFADYSVAFRPIRIDLPHLDLAILDHGSPRGRHLDSVVGDTPPFAVVRSGG